MSLQPAGKHEPSIAQLHPSIRPRERGESRVAPDQSVVSPAGAAVYAPLAADMLSVYEAPGERYAHLSNPAIASVLDGVPGALALLVAAGWEQRLDDTEARLVLRAAFGPLADALIELRRLHALLHQLTQLQGELVNGQVLLPQL